MSLQSSDCTGMFPKMWPDKAVARFLEEEALDDCDGHNTSTRSTITLNEGIVDDDLSFVSSGLESTLSHTSMSSVSLKDLSIAHKSTPERQEALKRFGDWNETVKYSQRISARHELRRRARTAAVQVETFIEELTTAAADCRVDRALVSQYTVPKELGYGGKNEDNEDMEFMSMVSAWSALSDLSAESRISTHGSVRRSSTSEISGLSSLSQSKYGHAGKKHSRGLDSKPHVTTKQQLAQRRLSLYMHSGDPFRPGSSNVVDQPAKLEKESVAPARLCQIATLSSFCNSIDACAVAEIENTSWRKHHILIYSIVFGFTSIAFAAILAFTH